MFQCAFCPNDSHPEKSLCLDCEMSFHLCMNSRLPGIDDFMGFPVFSATQYQEAARKWILHLKSRPPFEQDKSLNSWVGRFVDYWLGEIADYQPEIIVSVPSNPLRVLTERSLSHYTGEILSYSLGIPHKPSLLSLPWAHVLTKWTEQQKTLSKTDRVGNAHAIFTKLRGKENPRHGSRVLLVDDVYTTGATLRTCATKLNRAGFDVIGAFVLSRVPLATTLEFPERRAAEFQQNSSN
jgi:predicted amidophosphoribosyltransferase